MRWGIHIWLDCCPLVNMPQTQLCARPLGRQQLSDHKVYCQPSRKVTRFRPVDVAPDTGAPQVRHQGVDDRHAGGTRQRRKTRAADQRIHHWAHLQISVPAFLT